MEKPAQIYLTLADESLQMPLPDGNIAQRYHALLQAKYAQMDAHRATFATLFAQGLSGVDDTFKNISGTADPMHGAVGRVVNQADDTLDEALGDAFINVLYVFYLLLVLFRLYDRTPQHQASQHMLNFICDVIKLVRPLVFLPMFANAVRKLSAILVLVFGGIRPDKKTP